MTLLATGKVLVTGGRSTTGTTGLATAELYDRTTGTWSSTGSMTGGRFLHRATQLNTSGNATDQRQGADLGRHQRHDQREHGAAILRRRQGPGRAPAI